VLTQPRADCGTLHWSLEEGKLKQKALPGGLSSSHEELADMQTGESCKPTLFLHPCAQTLTD